MRRPRYADSGTCHELFDTACHAGGFGCDDCGEGRAGRPATRGLSSAPCTAEGAIRNGEFGGGEVCDGCEMREEG